MNSVEEENFKKIDNYDPRGIVDYDLNNVIDAWSILKTLDNNIDENVSFLNGLEVPSDFKSSDNYNEVTKCINGGGRYQGFSLSIINSLNRTTMLRNQLLETEWGITGEMFDNYNKDLSFSEMKNLTEYINNLDVSSEDSLKQFLYYDEDKQEEFNYMMEIIARNAMKKRNPKKWSYLEKFAIIALHDSYMNDPYNDPPEEYKEHFRQFQYKKLFDSSSIKIDYENNVRYFITPLSRDDKKMLWHVCNVNQNSEEIARYLFASFSVINDDLVKLHLISFNEDNSKYLRESVPKYYKSFRRLLPNTLHEIVESDTPFLICESYRAVGLDESYGGINWAPFGKNFVVYTDYPVGEYAVDPFNYAFVHEMGHAYDNALRVNGKLSDEEIIIITEEMERLFEKYPYLYPVEDEYANTMYNYWTTDSDDVPRTSSNYIERVIPRNEDGSFNGCEAFAELFRYYTLQPELMKIYAPEMYDFMNQFVNSRGD